MQTDLQLLFARIERRRKSLENMAQEMNRVQLHWTQNTNTWNTIQIIEHLVLSDETVGRAHRAGAVPRESLLLRFIPRTVRLALVLRALRRDVVLPLPSHEIVPQGSIPLFELLSRWNAARVGMGRDLYAMRGDEPTYFHPIIGQLTALPMLRLAETHTDYHARQLGALQAHPAFPRTESTTTHE